MKGSARLFELADAYAAAGKDRSAVEIFATLKRRMFADKKQNEFAAQLDVCGGQISAIAGRPGVLGGAL